jgi:ATP-dependent DNA helicase RecQ
MHEPISAQNLLASLEAHFGFTSFRPGQEDVVRSILAGRNTLAVMPTGRGKSLCFQLPALMHGGLSLVVSPLIALMKDQVDELARRGIAAAAINSSKTLAEQDEALGRAERGELRFLYIAPERFKVSSFMEKLPRLVPRHFVVDEAHCISQWGHDFRPDYLRLGRAIEASDAAQVIAMTATATPDVQRDIVKQLGQADVSTFVAGFERPNLFFAANSVTSDASREERIVELMRQADGPSIIYTASRKAAEEVGRILRRERVKVGVYHAGLEHEERIRVQEAFMSGRIQAIAATNAFGMGIDKADIRLVVHYQMPGSIEAYYQEAGRAGRDGKPSRCELFFSFADRHIQKFFLEGSNPGPKLIRDVYRLLLEDGGSRVELSARALAARIDGASDMAVGSALSLLERMDVIARNPAGESLGRIELGELFLARPPAERAVIRVKLWQWIRSKSRGDGAAIDVSPTLAARELGLEIEQVQRGLHALGDDGLIRYRAPFSGRAVAVLKRIDPHDLPLDEAALAEKRRRDEAKLAAIVRYGTIKGCRQQHLIDYFGGNSAPCGCCDACMKEAKPASSPARRVTAGDEQLRGKSLERSYDQDLFERLRAWRLTRSRSDGVPAFVVASDRALKDLAARKPGSLSALARCFGFGKIKVSLYGAEIIGVVRGKETEKDRAC